MKKASEPNKDGTRKTPASQAQTPSGELRGRPPKPPLERALETIAAFDALIEDQLNPCIRKAVALLRIFASEHAVVVRAWTNAVHENQKAEGLEYIGDQVADELVSLLELLESGSLKTPVAGKAAQ